MSAAIIRENEYLREVASAAMRLRRIGQQADAYEENLEQLYSDNPQMARSATGAIMFGQAYETALKEFDLAVLRAANAGMDWARENPALGPQKGDV